jgi:hypothetical protein
VVLVRGPVGRRMCRTAPELRREGGGGTQSEAGTGREKESEAVEETDRLMEQTLGLFDVKEGGVNGRVGPGGALEVGRLNGHAGAEGVGGRRSMTQMEAGMGDPALARPRLQMLRLSVEVSETAENGTTKKRKTGIEVAPVGDRGWGGEGQGEREPLVGSLGNQEKHATWPLQARQFALGHGDVQTPPGGRAFGRLMSIQRERERARGTKRETKRHCTSLAPMYACAVYLVTCLVLHFVYVYVCSHVYVFPRTFVLYIWSRALYRALYMYIYICSHVHIFPCTLSFVYMVT